MSSGKITKTEDQLLSENEELRIRLNEAEETLAAIRNGEVDAIVVSGAGGEKVFSISSAETPYRKILEEINQGAAALSADGIILYCNTSFAELLAAPVGQVTGSKLARFFPENKKNKLENLLKKSLSGKSSGDISLKAKGKQTLRLLFSFQALPSEIEADIFVIASDITEGYNYQERLKSEVKRRTAIIEKKNKKLRNDLLEIRSVKQKLSESDLRWEITLASIGDAIIATDLTGKISFINPVAETLTGWQQCDALQKPLSQVFITINEQSRCIIENPVSRVIETGMIIRKTNHALLISKDGREIPIDENGAPIINDEGRIIGVVLTFHDLTRQRETEEELKLSEENYRLLLQHAPAAICEIDFNGPVFRNVNDAMCIMSGYSREELLLMDPLDFIEDQNKGYFHERILLLKAGEKVDPSYEIEVRAKDGSKHWLLITHKLNWANGKPYSAQIVGNDITEIKHTGQALLESERNYKELIRNARTIIIQQDTSGKITFFNEYAQELFGYNSEEIVGKTALETIVPETESSGRNLISLVDNIYKDPDRYQVNINENVKRNGDRIWVEWHNKALYDHGIRTGLLSVGIDITERKLAEEALRVSEEKFRAIALSTPDHILIQDAGLRYTTVINPLLDLSENDMVGKTDYDLFPVRDADDLTRIKRKVIESGTQENLMIPLRDKNGGSHYFEGSYIPMSDSAGRINGIIGYFRNVTAHFNMENDLRMRETKFRSLFENSNDGILISDFETEQFIDCNLMFETITGYSKSEIVSMNVGAILKITVQLAGANIKKYKMGKGFRTETEIISKSGNRIPVDLSGFLSIIDNRRCIVSMIRDISERFLAEEALRKNEAQLKNLIATKDKFFNIVAHDLKNPFTSLLGSTELLYENIHLLNSEKISQLARILNDSAKSGYAILLNLLDWSRSQTGLIKINPEEINLKNLIDLNISELRLYSLNKRINIHSDVLDDIYVCSDKNMINTILRNLLSNGVKFTEKGGKVTVSVSITEKEFTISVSDTGTGISEDNIKNLFRIDKRFQLPGTDNEQGTGLGLKICSEFVEKLGGKIRVRSIENKGSDFIFSIPATLRSPA
jgi:PAS domain S-box-containing protein